MSRKPTPITALKASESVVGRMLSKLLKVGYFETVTEACEAYVLNALTNDNLSCSLKAVQGLYPWVTDVASDVMGNKVTPLTEHLLSMPGSAFIAKDSVRMGEDSLWLLVADPNMELLMSLQRMPARGLFHSFPIGRDHSMVMAIQLSSCLP